MSDCTTAAAQITIAAAAENDWTFRQEIPPPIQTTAKRHYGFLDLHSGYFQHIQYTENEVNDLGADAESCTSVERRLRRLKREEDKWDEEYYMYVCCVCYLAALTLRFTGLILSKTKTSKNSSTGSIRTLLSTKM